MSAIIEKFPGMTMYQANPEGISPISLTTIPSITERKIVLLATAVITHDNIFINGLFQNVYVIYRMFEAMGWLPIMIVNSKPTSISSIPWYMHNLRIMMIDDITKTPIPIKLYIEIGMSIDPAMRKFIKMCGGKICKLYLGNILNIDIETPMFYPSMFFSHHIIGEQDDIWVSPHYYQHSQYARAINHIDIESKKPMIAPYIWDSEILFDGGKREFKWKRAEKPEDDVFLILEPNISFQKCSLLPLLIVEAWFRKNPTWNGRVVLINGKRLQLIPFFVESVWNTLDIVKAGRVEVRDRMDILTILKEFPSAIPVCHQWNNEYNYMVLEYFATCYPVLHNASDWKDYGYYYKQNNIDGGVELITSICESHHLNMEAYKSHARALTWKHSPYNPIIQREWADLCSA
jgi:hypothetical protein